MMMMTCLIGDAVGTVFAASAAHARSAAAKAVMQAPSANLYLKFPIAEGIHHSLRVVVDRRKGGHARGERFHLCDIARLIACVVLPRPAGGWMASTERTRGHVRFCGPAARKKTCARKSTAPATRLRARVSDVDLLSCGAARNRHRGL